MPNSCTVCRHERRSEIDESITPGVSLRDIESQFGVSRSAAARHKRCIRALIAQNSAQVAATTVSTIEAYSECESVLREAMRQGNAAGALASIRTAVCILGEARALQQLKGATEAAISPSAKTAKIDEQILEWLEKRDQRMRQAIISGTAVDSSGMDVYGLLHAYDGPKQ